MEGTAGSRDGTFRQSGSRHCHRRRSARGLENELRGFLYLLPRYRTALSPGWTPPAGFSFCLASGEIGSRRNPFRPAVILSCRHAWARLSQRARAGTLSRVCLDRFALDAHFRDGAAHDAYTHAIGDFHIQFLVVDDLEHLADDAAAGHDLI